jgi:hypothetical protein
MHTYIHTYIHTYFCFADLIFRDLKTKRLCLYHHAGRGNIHTYTKNQRFCRTPEIRYPRPGTRF